MIENEVRDENRNDRIFARRVARELTPQELREVGGGVSYSPGVQAMDWDQDDIVSNPYVD